MTAVKLDSNPSEVKSAYEANADTNEFSDAEQTKLAGVETGATADQTGAEIKSAYEAEANTNAFTDAEQSKLAGVEALADVTDATNVDAAGAVMETDYDANTILAATTDNTPVTLTVGEETFVGRITSGNIAALTPAQVRTSLSVNEVLTPAQITTNQTGYNPTGLDTAERVRLSSDASRDISGIASAAATLAAKRLYNVGSFDIVLKHEDVAETTAANRLLSFTGADVTLQPDDNIEIWYDSTTARWRLG